MKKFPVFQILLALLIYAALFILASSCGLIHPASYLPQHGAAPIRQRALEHLIGHSDSLNAAEIKGSYKQKRAN